MLKWTIGAVTVTCIQESESDVLPGYLLPGLTAERLSSMHWLDPRFLGGRPGTLRLAIQALVVQSAGRLIVVDTCIGNERQGRDSPKWNGLQTSFMEDFAAAGFDRQEIGAVFCTHLHSDHVGWNTMRSGSDWVPTFPNARYLLGRREFEFWQGERDRGYGPALAAYADALKPVLDAGLVDLIDLPYELTPELRLVPTPGHTPGHASVEIQSEGERGLITGDFIHHPCQMAVPEIAEFGDADPQLAARTRREVLTACADAPVLVIGTHFPRPVVGHVRSDGAVFRFETQRSG